MSDTPPAVPGLAQHTLSRVREELANGRLPVVPQVLELIRVITTRSDQLSVQQVADVISQDPAVTARVVGIANKLGYNPTGNEITTVHHAISAVGFERIRTLAVSVILMENAESQLAAEEVREVAAEALAGGFLAMELVRPFGHVDPEMVFLCAVLRSYGRLILASFLMDEYEQACALAVSMGMDAACREVIGLTPLELGRELLEGEQLPRTIVDSLRPGPVRPVNPDAPQPAEVVRMASDFAVGLFDLLGAPEVSAEAFEVRAAQLARECFAIQPLSGAQILEHVDGVSQQCRAISASAGAAKYFTPLLRRMTALAEGQPLPPTSQLRRRFARTRDAAELAERRAAEQLRAATQRLGEMVDREPEKVGALFGDLTHALRLALRLEQSLVFLAGAGADGCEARFGHGPLFDALCGRVVVRPQHRTIFGLCLSRGEDIYIQDLTDERLRAFIPNWLTGLTAAHRLVLLALKDGRGSFGVVLGISRDDGSPDLVQAVRKELRDLRSRLTAVGDFVRASKA